MELVKHISPPAFVILTGRLDLGSAFPMFLADRLNMTTSRVQPVIDGLHDVFHLDEP